MLRRAALLCFLAVFAAMPILPAVTVSGIVLDSTNNPVEDVAVSLMPVPAGATSLRTHTASGGIFRFEHVEPGEYLVDVNKQGYIQSSEPGGPILNVASEQSAVPVTLRIARSASIAGRLLTQDGVPIGGASIEASCKGSRDQVTDA